MDASHPTASVRSARMYARYRVLLISLRPCPTIGKLFSEKFPVPLMTEILLGFTA